MEEGNEVVIFRQSKNGLNFREKVIKQDYFTKILS